MKKKPTYNPKAGRKLRMLDDRIIIFGKYFGKVHLEKEVPIPVTDVSGLVLLMTTAMAIELLAIMALVHRVIFGNWVNL